MTASLNVTISSSLLAQRSPFENVIREENRDNNGDLRTLPKQTTTTTLDHSNRLLRPASILTYSGRKKKILLYPNTWITVFCLSYQYNLGMYSADDKTLHGIEFGKRKRFSRLLADKKKVSPFLSTSFNSILWQSIILNRLDWIYPTRL